MFIDIHRHSSNKGNADIVMRNLFPQETGQIIPTGYFSVGLHPWHIQEFSADDAIHMVSESAQNKAVIAIGETGIDKTINADIGIQKNVFLKHIDIAKEVNKPIIIHCVKSYNEILKIRKDTMHKKPWIFHWYNASPEMGVDLISKGCFLSFGLTLFKEESKAYRTFLKIPLENLFLETDDARLTIQDVYQKASEIKGISLSVLQDKVIENFYNCFGIRL